MKIREIRASVHSSTTAIPLLEHKVQGDGRDEQKEFVFCEVETDDGRSGLAITGHFLARSVVVALKSYLLPVVRDISWRWWPSCWSPRRAPPGSLAPRSSSWPRRSAHRGFCRWRAWRWCSRSTVSCRWRGRSPM